MAAAASAAAVGVDVDVLGPLRLRVDGEARPLMRGASTRLLVALTAAWPRALPDRVLLDRLADDAAESISLASLRNAAMRVRAATAPYDVVLRDGDGYRLSSDVARDVAEFEAAVNTARSLARADPAAARPFVEAALALIRGTPFDDVADLGWARPDLDEWDERIAEAEDLLGDLIVRAHGWDEVHVLVRHARARPRRERRWVQAITAYHQTSRIADGLRAVREARQALADVGLTPGVELRAAADALVAGHDIDPGSEQPPLYGRDDLVTATARALVDHPVVTLTGIGGVGKSAVAEAVRRQREADGTYRLTVWVDLTAVDDDDLVEEAVRTDAGLGSAERSPAWSTADLLTASAGGDRVLVVLDNAEHVICGVNAVAKALVVEHVDVLVTTREVLGVDGEHVVTVAPLDVPAERATPAECGANPAVQLMRRRAAAPLEAGVAAALVRAVGGLPLAIELVGAMVSWVPPADVLDSLERHGLVEGDPGRSRRSLAGVLDDAIAHLPAGPRSMLARVGELTGPFTLATADHLAGVALEDVPVVEGVMPALIRLAQSSLIVVQRGLVQRYSLTPLQRAAARRLLPPPTQEALRAAIDRWYVDFAAARFAEGRTDRGPDALRLIDAEWTNLRAVARRCSRAGDHPAALALVGALRHYIGAGYQQVGGTDLAEEVLAAAGEPVTVDHAPGLLTLAHGASSWAGYARRIDASRSAAAVAATAGRDDLAREGRLFAALGDVWRGRLAEGIPALEDLVAIDPDGWVGAHAEVTLASIGAVAGAIDTGTHRVHLVARRREAAGDRLGAGLALMQFGMLVERHGDADVAERLLVRAIEVVGDAFPIVSAHASYALGLIDERRAPGSGRERMLEAGAHFRRVGDLGCLNGVNRALADVSRHDGDDDGALDRLRQTVWMMPGVDDHELAASLVQIAEIYLDRGQVASAGALAGVAHRLRSGRGIGWNARQRARFYAVRAGAARSEEPLSVEAAIAVACDG